MKEYDGWVIKSKSGFIVHISSAHFPDDAIKECMRRFPTFNWAKAQDEGYKIVKVKIQEVE